MQLFAPKYYPKFKCIADRCRHSCCVGWEIDIDGKTLDRYENSEGGYSEKIKESIDYTDTPHFCLVDGRCPHLDGRGLCRIITELSEDCLADICREHPRFYNDTVRGKEVGVGMACEEAARIILESENYRERVVIGEIDGEPCDFDFDAARERDAVYDILSDEKIPYEKRLCGLWEKYGASPRILTDSGWREILSSLEYLNEENRDRFSVYSSSAETPKEYEAMLERFLAYLIFRHASAAESCESFRSALGFAFFAERLFASMIKNAEKLDTDAAIEIARVISEELEYSTDNTDTVRFEFEAL